MANDLRERFWKNVNVKTPIECWPWTNYTNPEGYGQIGDNCKTRRAHRVSYELYFGHLSDDLYVCHHCDNPSCVNPFHLYQGTEQQNTRDMVERDRQARGQDFSNTKLSDKEVLQIRREYKNTDLNQYDLAEKFGVNRSQIQRIVVGKHWTHVGGPIKGKDFDLS